MMTKPGIYPEIDTAAYYGDPCPTPSLTQSLVKILLERSPLHAWYQHPRLNPDYVERDNREPWLDVGNIAHKILLGRGKDVITLPEEYEDWRKQAARDLRDQYAREGKLAVLVKHHAKAQRMVNAAREQLDLRGCGGLFGDGDAEACIAWREDGLWLRQLIDWISADRHAIVDYKTTGESAAPEGLGRKLVDWGWHIQAAMAERGLDNLQINVGRRQYLWVCQETDPPYQLTITEISEAALTLGRWQLETAIGIWRRCVEANQFPGYPLQIEHPELPPWHAGQVLDKAKFDPEMLRV